MERDNSESSGSSWTPETKRKAGSNKEACVPLRNKRIKIEDIEPREVPCGPDDRNMEPAAVLTTVDGPLHNASPRNEKTIRYIGKDVTRPQDLRLLVGPEQVEIRVHRVILELRCPQMLQQAIPDTMDEHIQRQGSMRVWLPEDDPDATFTFLALTCSGVEDHSKALSTLGSGQFAVVSMVARKYRCDALLLDLYLNMFSMHQVECLPPAEREFADLWNAALSAYWLRSPTCFERLTCCLIQKQRSENASFLYLVQASPDKELAWKLSLALHESTSVPPDSPWVGVGLCLDCFENAERSFAHQVGCSTCANKKAPTDTSSRDHRTLGVSDSRGLNTGSPVGKSVKSQGPLRAVDLASGSSLSSLGPESSMSATPSSSTRAKSKDPPYAVESEYESDVPMVFRRRKVPSSSRSATTPQRGRRGRPGYRAS